MHKAKLEELIDKLTEQKNAVDRQEETNSKEADRLKRQKVAFEEEKAEWKQVKANFMDATHDLVQSGSKLFSTWKLFTMTLTASIVWIVMLHQSTAGDAN